MSNDEIKITICHVTAKSIINFNDKETYKSMQNAIKNCIENPLKYPYITHNGFDEVTIFTAEYLKNSLIIWSLTPKTP